MSATLTKAATRKQIENARALGWHEFVCGYVAAVTKRAPFSGYVVRKVAAGWILSFMGADMFPAMAARDLYVSRAVAAFAASVPASTVPPSEVLWPTPTQPAPSTEGRACGSMALSSHMLGELVRLVSSHGRCSRTTPSFGFVIARSRS